jgi:hypothetical protein
MRARDSFRVIRQESASLDFGSIGTLTSADLTISLPGAKVGDLVVLGPPAAPTAGIIFWAFVSAADVVTVRASNFTAGSINPAAFDFNVAVLQFF